MSIGWRLVDNHLLCTATGSYVIGIISSHYNLDTFPSPITAFSLLLIALFFSYIFRLQRCNLALTILLAFFAGNLLGIQSSTPPYDRQHVFTQIVERTDCVAIGTLARMPVYDGTTSQIILELRALATAGEKKFTPARGKVLFRMRAPWPENYFPGAEIAIRGYLQRPARYKTPGTFNYPAYLARKGIWITGYITSPVQITPLNNNHFSTTRHLRYFLERQRLTIGTFLDEHLPPAHSSLYRALLIGDRTRIPETVIDGFKTSGAMHILAISGMHVSLIASLLYLCCYWLLRCSQTVLLRLNARKLAVALCIPPIILYCSLAGMNAPVVRACVISIIGCLAFCSNRPKTISTLVACAALFLLIPDPQTLFTASFQLSFTAFIAIVACLPAIQCLLYGTPPSFLRTPSILQGPLRWLLAGLLVSAAATLGTAPIMIYHFHRFPLIGIFSSLVLEPLICLWSLPLGFLSLPLIYLADNLATYLLTLGSTGLTFSLALIGQLNTFPQTVLHLPAPSLLLIAMYYLSIIFFITSLGRHGNSCRIGLCLLVVTMSCLLNPHLLPARPGDKKDSIHLLDVGHGAAVLIQSSEGRNILIDGGGSSFAQSSIGERILAPYLWANNVQTLHTIIISHPDADHFNGIPYLIEHFTPSALWTNTAQSSNSEFQQMLQQAQKNKVEIVVPEHRTTLEVSPAISISCIANISNYTSFRNDSNAGIILRVQINGHHILIPGDISTDMERQLMLGQHELGSGILIAAHHGSATSNSPQFINAVSPDVILVSAGVSRKNTFPSAKLLDYAKHHDIPIYTTADVGTIKLAPDKSDLVLMSQQYHTDNPLHRKTARWFLKQRIKAEPKRTRLQ